MIRFTLDLRHASLQGYILLLLSISLLNKIQQGGVDSLKTLKVLQEEDQISTDLVLMVNEMCLHKVGQYHAR